MSAGRGGWCGVFSVVGGAGRWLGWLVRAPLVLVVVWWVLPCGRYSRAGLDRRVRQPDWNPSGVSADDDGDGLIVP